MSKIEDCRGCKGFNMSGLTFKAAFYIWAIRCLKKVLSSDAVLSDLYVKM